jgi:hypothetical protein
VGPGRRWLSKPAVEAGLKLVHYGGQKLVHRRGRIEAKARIAFTYCKCNLLMVHLAAEVDQFETGANTSSSDIPVRIEANL